jgi:outer membrane protein TolC
MRMSRRAAALLAALAAPAAWGPRTLPAQVATPATAPAPAEIGLEAFLARVIANHPLVRQAEAARRQADAELLVARGGFDPYVSAIWDTKRFKGIGYYDELDARIVLPTPWGVDFKLGWERAAGQIINPERATPSEGLLSFGVMLPIGPRIVTDERRTALRQAEIAQDAADADRDAALARVVQGAARDWGLWAETERRAQITAEGVTLAAFRLEALRRRIATGDAAAIDSIEATAELRAREVQRLDARAAADAARLVAEAWLWRADGTPDRFPAGAVASTRAELGQEAELRERLGGEGLRYLVARHPFVQAATARWRQAEAARRLAAVNILPTASVELSGLAAGGSLGDVALPQLSGEETKFSGNVRLPLFPRREVGRLRSAEERTRALQQERERVRRDVEVEAQRALIELVTVDSQLVRQEVLVTLQQRLLDAEQQRFLAGESTLLIVNLRERTLLDERLRLAAMVARRARALGTLAIALGTPQLQAGETAQRGAR